MNEDLFLAFLAVVDSGSFSGAARKIHLTQPAISQRIKNLEDLVNAPLFERAPGRSRPKLTEVGRIVEEEARHSLLRWNAMKSEIRSLSTCTLSLCSTRPAPPPYTCSHSGVE